MLKPTIPQNDQGKDISGDGRLDDKTTSCHGYNILKYQPINHLVNSVYEVEELVDCRKTKEGNNMSPKHLIDTLGM